MALSPSCRVIRPRLLWVVGLLACIGGGVQAQAAETLPYEPPCAVLPIPASESLLQPMRIQPSTVKAKNAMGCLSPSDAIYGPDGCPLRFCGGKAGVFALPPQASP